MTNFFSLFILLFLAGCLTKSPGEQCLESFRMDLKDPSSGEVISFEGSKLTYSAKNSYGARTQGKALCYVVNDKWERARHLEQLTALNLATDRLNASTECIKNGKNLEDCTGGSYEIRKSHILNKDVNLDLMREEAMRDLGFN